MAEHPQTRIWLYSIDTDTTYKNVRYFPNEESRELFFSSAYNPIFYNHLNLQYIRKNSIVDLPILFDNLSSINYCIYDNGEGQGKEYAFVTEIEFISFNCSRLHLQYDIFQNSLSKIWTTNCYSNIIRHMGNYTNYENLVNDYNKSADILDFKIYEDDYYGFYAFNVDIDRITSSLRYDKPYRLEPFNKRVKTLLLPVSKSDVYNESNVKAIQDIISSPKTYSSFYINCPYSVYSAIKNMDSVSFLYTPEDGGEVSFSSTKGQTGVSQSLQFTVSDTSLNLQPIRTYDDLKLSTYPYEYIELSTGESSIITDRSNIIVNSNNRITRTLEYSIDDTGIFLRVYFGTNYNKIIINDSITMPISKYKDVLNEYMETNKYRIATSLAISTAMTFMGTSFTSKMINPATLTGNTMPVPYGSDLSMFSGDTYSSNLNMSDRAKIGISGIAKTLQDYHAMSLQPYQGTSSGVYAKGQVNNPNGLITISHYIMNNVNIKDVESYYNRFGYYYNTNEKITYRRRKYYDYLQTSGSPFANLRIHNDEKEILNNIFNSGVTLWHCVRDGTALIYKHYGEYTTNSENEVI